MCAAMSVSEILVSLCIIRIEIIDLDLEESTSELIYELSRCNRNQFVTLNFSYNGSKKIKRS